MSRLTKAEWKALEAKTGKSSAIMQELEKTVAEYGEQALVIWHFHNGLRQEKPRYRVKAIAA